MRYSCPLSSHVSAILQRRPSAHTMADEHDKQRSSTGGEDWVRQRLSSLSDRALADDALAIPFQSTFADFSFTDDQVKGFLAVFRDALQAQVNDSVPAWLKEHGGGHQPPQTPSSPPPSGGDTAPDVLSDKATYNRLTLSCLREETQNVDKALAEKNRNIAERKEYLSAKLREIAERRDALSELTLPNTSES